MKKTFLFERITMLSILIVLTSYNLPAQLLVENFDYPTSTVLSTFTSSGWSVASSAGSSPIDITNGLSFVGYAGSGIGGAANIDNNGEDIYKTFTAITTGVVYASFIIKTQSANAASYFFSFTSNAFNTSSYACRIYVNATGNGVGIGPTTPTTYQPITPETPTLLVIKYDLDTKESKLYILNTFQATEPTSANASATETVTTNVGGILMRQYNANQRIIVDGIRVGTSWSDAVASGCTSSNLTFENTTINKTVGDASFTQTATSLNLTTAITYSSSAPLVAAVNASTGEITLGSAGTATITATQNVGTQNSISYCSSTASYNINVKNTPTLTVTEVQFPTLTTKVGIPITETINISGINLSNDIAITIAGADANMFSISQNSIAQQAGIGPNTIINVTYTPTTPGSHTATLNLSSAGTDNISQVLNGLGTSLTATKIVTSDLNFSSQNGNIVFSSRAGIRIDIYNTIGQKLKSITTIDGFNSIYLNYNGVLLIKANNITTKILL